MVNFPATSTFCIWIQWFSQNICWGARWLSGRVSDSGARGPGFETYLRRVVSLSKTLYSQKVLVNYPGSDGSVPTWLKPQNNQPTEYLLSMVLYKMKHFLNWSIVASFKTCFQGRFTYILLLLVARQWMTFLWIESLDSLSYTSNESRGTFRQKARSVVPLNGWACAVKICHDGMLEDTNSLDGAQLYFWCINCTNINILGKSRYLLDDPHIAFYHSADALRL